MNGPFRHLVDNLGSVVLALLLAFAVWFAATLQVDPFETRSIAPVPIVLMNQPENTILFEPIPTGLSVEVRAPQSVLQELKVSDFDAVLDLTDVEPGAPVQVTVQITPTHTAVRIQSVDPVAQVVHLERTGSITVAVSVDIEGDVAIGYEAQPVRLNPDRVVVSGAEPYLRDIVSVTGSLSVEEARANVVQRVLVSPRNAEGRLVGDVSWTPDRVEAQVQVSRRVGFKPDVEVVPDLRIAPAPGYRLGSVAASPSVVTLKGPPSVLDSMPGFIKTFPISITDATEDFLQQSPLMVPASVVVIGVNYVTVTVGVLPIQSSRTLTDVVDIQGVPPGWVATATPGVVSVIVEGPDAIVSDLQSGDIQTLLNMYDYPLGVHRVQPIILAPADVRVVGVIPETIEVTIETSRSRSILTDTLPYIIEPAP